jgi:hypothetical protein
MKILLALALLAACDSKEKPKDNSVEGMIDDANVDFARKEVPEIEKKLASPDPGSAAGSCAVVKPDLPKIRKADKKLADKIEKLCGHDFSIRSLTVFVEKAEAARAKDPNDKFLMECGSWDIYMKPVIAASSGDDPAIAPLKERYAKACPGKN